MNNTVTSAESTVASPREEADDFRQWLAEHHDEFAHLRVLHVDADERVRVLKELQALLYDAGWARLGWAPEISGRVETSCTGPQSMKSWPMPVIHRASCSNTWRCCFHHWHVLETQL